MWVCCFVKEQLEEQKFQRKAFVLLESSSLLKLEFQRGCSRLELSVPGRCLVTQGIGSRSLSDREGRLVPGFPYAATKTLTFPG